MSETLAIPSFDDMPPDALAQFAAQNLELMRSEAESVASLTEQAYQRAWAVGRAAVHLKDNVLKFEQPELWEQWATDNIGAGGNYMAIYRCMREFRRSPDKPPGRTSSQFKQLQIMWGEEPLPKTTPRKMDAHRFVNFKAACSSIQRWFKGGSGITGLTADELQEVLEDLAPVVAIAQAVNVAKMNLEGGE